MAKRNTSPKTKAAKRISLSKAEIQNVLKKWSEQAVSENWDGDWRDDKAGARVFWKIAKALYGG